MGDNRFTYKNGTIYDNESKGDVHLSYDLNADEGRSDILDFMNDREYMINELNDEIERLHDVIDRNNEEFRNKTHKIRKMDRIIILQKELIEIYSTLSKVIDSEL
jgi:hypothetical protein